MRALRLERLFVPKISLLLNELRVNETSDALREFYVQGDKASLAGETYTTSDVKLTNLVGGQNREIAKQY